MESMTLICFVLLALVPLQCDAALSDCSSATTVITTAAGDATCATHFSNAAAQSVMDSVCSNFLDGLECTANLLVTSGELTQCTDAIETVITQDATTIFTSLATAGITFDSQVSDNIGQCYDTQQDAARTLIGSLTHVCFAVLIVLGILYGRY